MLNPDSCPSQRPWHEYEHNFQIMYKVGMGHKPPIPERLSPEGKDFLSHCLESEPRMRWTASQLLDHSFVKVTLIHKSPALCQDGVAWLLH